MSVTTNTAEPLPRWCFACMQQAGTRQELQHAVRYAAWLFRTFDTVGTIIYHRHPGGYAVDMWQIRRRSAESDVLAADYIGSLHASKQDAFEGAYKMLRRDFTASASLEQAPA